MDRISNLPDEIICHIGSFLSAKEAAFTTVLAKKWRNLFTIIHKLHFDGSLKNGESFTDFVDGVLALPATSRVRNFSLKWFAHVKNDELINRCLCHVLKLGVMALELQINDKEGYSLPFEIFTCETVSELTLGYGFAIDILPANVFLPSLKTLSLYKVGFFEFGRCAFKTLLGACPLLEELTIRCLNWEHWRWSRVVSSPTLKRLTITRGGWSSFDASDFKSVSFETPSLAYLFYSDYVPKRYLNVDFSSLVEAKLHLCPEEHYNWDRTDTARFHPINLLNGLKDVESLNLCSIMSLDMFYVFREALPVFEKLLHISVALSNFCWYPLPLLIKKSPNLKTLTIDGRLHYRSFYYCPESTVCLCVSEYAFLLKCPLEILKITEYYGSLEELIQMKYILGKLSCLEL
ncbi:hypothetical protein EUTSA_v10006436mg, partial [Eutrema salsugineum]